MIIVTDVYSVNEDMLGTAFMAKVGLVCYKATVNSQDRSR